jgi:flagellar secretion chaperone FliS
MNITTPINIYNKVGTESSVMRADPHKLISMLFHGALLAIANAKNGMLRKETAVKGKSISKAIAIIGEGLHISLDKSVGGELAQNLSSLYTYMVMRLVDANLKNDITALDEVIRLLTELTEAWDSIRPNNVQS